MYIKYKDLSIWNFTMRWVRLKIPLHFSKFNNLWLHCIWSFVFFEKTDLSSYLHTYTCMAPHALYKSKVHHYFRNRCVILYKFQKEDTPTRIAKQSAVSKWPLLLDWWSKSNTFTPWYIAYYIWDNPPGLCCTLAHYWSLPAMHLYIHIHSHTNIPTMFYHFYVWQ